MSRQPTSNYASPVSTRRHTSEATPPSSTRVPATKHRPHNASAISPRDLSATGDDLVRPHRVGPDDATASPDPRKG